MPSLAYARRSVGDGVAVLAGLGLRCDFSENAFEISDDGLTAGPAETRAADLHAAFLDPDVAAVLCSVGGFGSRDLLPLLDGDLIRAPPKPLIGRSDNTYLNAFLWESAGLTSYSGVAFVTQFADLRTHPDTIASFADVVLGEAPVRLTTSSVRTEVTRPAGMTGDHPWHEVRRPGRDVWLRPGRAVGRLVGGEIGIVASLLEAHMLTVDESVLWIDVVDAGLDYFAEQLARLEPLVAGRRVRALLIADNPTAPFEVWLETVRDAISRLALECAGPVLIGGNMGHYQPFWVMPYGDWIVVDSTTGITVNAK